MKIEKSYSNDSGILTDITKKSKAYWGYPEDLLDKWSDQLTITKAYIESNNVFKMVLDNKVIGYYSFFYESNTTIRLDNLFLLPDFIGKGFGKILMDDFLKRIKTEGTVNVILESDPGAEKFYKKFGFVTKGLQKTTVKNRFLPIMELKMDTL
ncbi:GNAT family N-acetyltransferase [Flavobacterium sp. MK4S-17]|uniref:GNAT family N-acetyltransferase n=1 Tax=Flavobacterium sp. MK4S-17 TaxID=2543737 RepID=UPI00135C51BC|nr:GNAT family N-acetyltransferase [Flavobacterium sp. MK4S-17]